MSVNSPSGRIAFSDELEGTFETFPACTRIEFHGSIESEIRTDSLEEFDSDHLILDLEGIQRTTSFGIKQWVKLLNTISANYYCFTRAQPPIVHQFNMVYDFSGEGDLLSLFLPYACPHCRDEFTSLVDLREEYTQVSEFDIPAEQCPECGTTAEFDDIPEIYLEYVSQQGPPTVPSAVGRVLDGKTSVSEDSADNETRNPFRLQKEVVGDVTALWATGYLDQKMPLERIAEGLEDPLVMICSELDGIEPEALLKFQELVGGKILLARISMGVMEQIVENTGVMASASPITTVAPVYCQECNWEGERELALKLLLEPSRPAVETGCPECFGDLAAAVSTHERRLYAAFDPPEVPSNVASYLTHCDVHPAKRRDSKQVDKVIGSSFGRYTLLRRIGTGGMAEIFLAKQEGAGNFERTVVIKRLRLEKSTETNLIESFKREATIASRLSHSNVVQVTDFGQTDQFYYMAMEYVDGPDLREVLAALADRSIHMPIDFAVFVMLQISDALRAAHNLTNEAGEPTPIVHRDISPHNILISRHGTPKLTDFGIARIESELHNHSDKVVQGKIPYFPPEVLQPELGPVDGRTDIYSLGTVFYECITGLKPFRGQDRAEKLKSIVTDAPPRPSEFRPEATSELEEVLKQSMAKRPEARYPRIEDLQVDLEEMLDQFGGVKERRFGEWVVNVMRNKDDVRGADRERRNVHDGTESPPTDPAASPDAGPAATREDTTTESLPVKALVYQSPESSGTDEIPQVAAAAVDSIEVIESLDALSAAPSTYDIVLVDVDVITDDPHSRIVETFKGHHREHRLLAYCKSHVRNRLDLLFGELGLTNLVAYSGDFRNADLLTTLQKVVRGDIFGLEHYFSWGADSERFLLRQSDDIKAVADSAYDFLDDPETSHRLLRSFSMVTEELASNALYNAPVDSNGNRKYAGLSRTEEVELAENEQAEARFCTDGHRAAVSVRDPFGSVSIDEVIDYIGKPFVTENQKIVDVESDGGAGIGLSQSFKALTHLILNVAPGQTTEFIGLLHLADRYSDVASRPKSFNVFVADRDRSL